MPLPDRLKLMLALAQDKVTGLDYVSVSPNQLKLTVHFLKDPAALALPMNTDLKQEQVAITPLVDGNLGPETPESLNPAGSTVEPGASPTPMVIDSVQWIDANGKKALEIQMPEPGGFILYRLKIEDSRIDPFFSEIVFSFKVHCPSDLDCKQSIVECEDGGADVAIDYRARDFHSFKKVLLEYARLKYPQWQDRLEADFGVMLAELFSALGDEMTYYQDRIYWEGFWESATQRRSLRRHARLVDAHMRDGKAAQGFITVLAKTGQSGNVPAGADVWAKTEAGEEISFEVGRGLKEVVAHVQYAVHADRNQWVPHIWDEDHTCHAFGERYIDVEGDLSVILNFNQQDEWGEPGQYIILQEEPADPGQSRNREMVFALGLEILKDSLVGVNATRLWLREPLKQSFLLTNLKVYGNVLPVTAGKTFPNRESPVTSLFVAGMDPVDMAGLPTDEQAKLTRCVERMGANNIISYLLSLVGSDDVPLTWLGSEQQTAEPEVHIQKVDWDGVQWQDVNDWQVRQSFVGTNSSQPFDDHALLEDGVWKRIVGFREKGTEWEFRDYAGNKGNSLRFGDGEFGRLPDKGDVFEVTYRLGNGRLTNAGTDTVRYFDDSSLVFVESVTNSLPCTGGEDPESITALKQWVPQAYQAVTYRAVRPEDYAEAMERLAFVQKAGARFRWTGSWLTARVTADPLDAQTLGPGQKKQMAGQLGRFRQAGRDSCVFEPRYADVHLRIQVCAEDQAYAGQVKETVLEALVGPQGFFSPNTFTFSTALWRSQLEAAIQCVKGVKGVLQTQIRRTGYFQWRLFSENYYPVGDDELIRVANDTTHPDWGTVNIKMKGGA